MFAAIDVSDVVEAFLDPNFPIGTEVGLRYASRGILTALAVLQTGLLAVGILMPPVLYRRGGLVGAAAALAVIGFGSVALRIFLFLDVAPRR